MYRIVGIDGHEYGPVTADQLKQWAVEHRVNAQTRVKAESDTEWRLLGTLPEFVGLATASYGVPPVPAVTARTSGLAIASLVCGVLGLFTCGIAALLGLVLGIVALIRIGNSQGRLSGKGLAIGGLVVSGIFVFMLPVFAAMLLPALSRARERAQTIHCVNNVKQLGLATRIYVADHSETFPQAEHWSDAITNQVGSPKVFQCSMDPELRCAFAFNAKLGGRKESEVNPQTVMFFESDEGWNAHGGSRLLKPHRHSESRHIAIIGFADGSVRQVKQSELSTLRWEP